MISLSPRPDQSILDSEKFEALLHHVVWKGGTRLGWDTGKIQRILWFADALTYLETGTPLTGAIYVRGESGPVTQQFTRAVTSLETEERIVAIEGGGRRDDARFRSIAEPKESTLTEAERRRVERAIAAAEDSASGEKLQRPWEFAALGEEIPFVAALARRMRAPRGDELAWARQVSDNLKQG